MNISEERRRARETLLNQARRATSARLSAEAMEASRILIFKEQDLSPAFSSYISNLSIQTFGGAIQCSDNCIYFVFTKTPVTPDLINNDPDQHFAGVYTIVKPPHLTYYEIYNVITNPALRGQGVARMMITQGMKRIIREVDASARFWLTVDPDNPFFDAAVRAYIRCGFTYPRISSTSPTGINWQKGMLAMTTDLPEPSPNHTIDRATKLRKYVLLSNRTRSITISTQSIKELYDYNVRNQNEQGTHEMAGYFTQDPTSGLAVIASYEPFPYPLTTLPPGWETRVNSQGETYYIDNNTSKTSLKPDFMLDTVEVDKRGLSYNAIWGYKTSSRPPSTYEITWHTHPWFIYSPTEQARILDLPSHYDLIYMMSAPITTPLRLHILFSYETIYYMQMSRSFTSVLAYILNDGQGITMLNDISECIKLFLEQLFLTVCPTIDLKYRFVPNIRTTIISTWCNITLGRILDAYGQSTEPTVRSVMATLEQLMGRDELLFYIGGVEYEEVVKNPALNVSYYAI